jgi:membrane associated rhomboid family serine protease
VAPISDLRHYPERNVSFVIPLSDERAGARPTVVTIAIIIACVAVYAFIQPTFGRETAEDTRFAFQHAAIPYELTHGEPLSNCQVADAVDSANRTAVCSAPVGDQAFAPGKAIYLAVLTSLFLHGGILHIAGNLLFLWVFGRRVEDRLGHVLFAAFYLAAGIVAAVAQTLASPNSTVPFIGASGAIAGVMGAYLVWFPHARINTLFFVFVIIWFRIQAQWILLAWFVLQFFTSPNSGIAWVAHVGGFLFGMVVAALWRLGHRTRARF